LSQTSEIRPSIEANSLAEKAALEEIKSERGNDTLKEVWLSLANQLEIEGIPKEKISSIGKNLIITQKKEKLKKLGFPEDELKSVTISGWWREVMQGIGCTDSKYSSTEVTVTSPDNSSIYTKNENMLILCDNIIDVLHTIKDKAKDFPPLEEKFNKKQLKEFYYQQGVMIDNIKNSIDNKTKIPENTETFLLECLATVTGNTNKCGEIFQQIIVMRMKEQGKFLTQKQATKFQTGGKQSQLFLLSPTDRDFAIYEGYTGTRCSKCQSFRVRPKSDHTNKWECYDCGEILPKQHIPKCSTCQLPLYQERLKQVAASGKCPECKDAIELPQTLIDQANS